MLQAFSNAVEALNAVREALSSTRPPVEVSAEAALRLRAVADLLAPHAVGPDAALVGRVAGVAGRGHPLVPPLVVDARSAERLDGRVVLRRSWIGTGGAHGGTLPLLFDEAFGALANHGDRPYGRTAFLHVDFRSVTPLDRELRLAAVFDREEGRKRFLRGTLHDGEVLVAEAHALFVVLRPGQP